MDVAAAKARAAAKELRVAMGGGSDVEADMAAEELGIKQGDAEKIANADKPDAAGKGDKSGSKSAAKPSSGISVVNFAVPTTEEADILVAKMFKQQLIADAQISSSNTHRVFMRYKKMIEADNIVKMRLITTDARIPAVIRFLIQNNPNSSDNEVIPSIVAEQFNSGSKEYISWVKNQTT